MKRTGMYWSLGLAAAASATIFACRGTNSSSTGGSGVKETVPDGPEYSAIQLTMTGDEATGEVTASFAFGAVAEFNPGDTVELRYDVIATEVEPVVNCSALRGTAQVTLEGDGKTGTFKKNVGTELFASPVRPDPNEAAKADMGNLLRNPGPLRVEGCLVRSGTTTPLATASVTPTATVQGFALAGDEAPINAYGKVCAEKLGELPAFSCLDDTLFKEIPMEVTDGAGGTTRPTAAVQKCDRPIYLPTGGGYCKPWARIGRIKVNQDVTAAVVCRRYWSPDYPPISGVNDPIFNDVAVIQHNKKTGETCWFQALGVRYGARVPPPSEVKVPDAVKVEHPKAANAKDFWLTPAETADVNCIGCHDADAWMHSPYVREAKDEEGNVWLPSSPRSKYVMLGGKFGFNKWPTVYSVKPKDNPECTNCHRLGGLSSCDTWGPDAGGVGNYLAAFKTAKGKAFPTSHWMPPKEDEEIATIDDWKSSYEASHKAYLACCQVKDAAGKRILGKKGEFQSMKPNYGKVMSQAHIDALAAKNCMVTPISEVRD